MKRFLWLAGTAAAFAAVIVLTRGPAEEAPPVLAVAKAVPTAPADTGPAVQHATVTVEPSKPSPQPDPAARKGPKPPEPLPAWIDVASFVAAGLPRNQAEALVAGLVKLHERKARVAAHLADHRNTSKHLDHLNLLVMEIGPRLAAGLADGSIPHTWGPVPAEWPKGQTNDFAVVDGSKNIDRIDWSVAGAKGVLQLQIPAGACDQETLTKLRAALQEPKPVGRRRADDAESADDGG